MISLLPIFLILIQTEILQLKLRRGLISYILSNCSYAHYTSFYAYRLQQMSAALGSVGHSVIITACVNVRGFGYVPSIEKVVYSEHDLWYSAMVNTPL